MTSTRRINTPSTQIWDDLFWTAFGTDTQKGYPPYNLVYATETKGYLEFALAGFKQEELKVNVTQTHLTVSGSSKPNSDSVRFVHQGIARRDFEKKFSLSRDTVITGATYSDGMLRVDFEMVIPEEKKPREVPINFVGENTAKSRHFLRD